MWVEFVVASHSCSEGFSAVFLPPQKSAFSKFQFNLETMDKWEGGTINFLLVFYFITLFLCMCILKAEYIKG